MLRLKMSGVNWVRNLPSYAEALNLESREFLKWRSPFERYYGRKSNSVTNTIINTLNSTVVDDGSDNDEFNCDLLDTRRKSLNDDVRTATARCAKRMVAAGLRKKHLPYIKLASES